MAADSFVEEVVFRQRGVDEVVDAVRGLEEEIEKARKQQDALADALSSPAYRRNLADTDAIRRVNAQNAASVIATARATERLRLARDGSYLKGYQEELRVRRQLRQADDLERSQRLRADREAFRQGDPVSRARSGLRQAMAEAAFARDQRRAQTTARFQMVKSGEFAADARGELRERLAGDAAGREEEKVRLRERLAVSAGQELAAARGRLEVEQLRQQVADKIAAAERAVRPAQATGLALARERLRADRERAAAVRTAALYDRQAALEARFGVGAGGRLAAAERAVNRPGVRAAGGLAIGAAAVVGGVVRRGFQDTAELERFDLQLQLASRSVANSFKPAIDTATGVLRRVERFGNNLTESQQNLLMGGTLLAGGLGGTALAVGLAKRIGSLMDFGFLSRAVGGSFSQGAASFASQAGAQAAGTAVGQTAANIAGGAAAGGATRGAAAAGASRLGSFGPYAAAAAVTLGYGKVLYDSGDYYRYAREQRGRSKVSAGLYSFGASLYDNLAAVPNAFGAGLETYDQKFATKNRLEQAGGGFRELGAGFDTLTASADRLALGSDPEVVRLLNETNKKLDEQNRLVAAQKETGPREKRGND